MHIRYMDITDYEGVLALWRSIEGFYVREVDDSLEGIKRFLDRNPQMSVIALDKNTEQIIGSILCGYDGRCAYLYHVCVKSEFRHKKIGNAMVEFVIETLRKMQVTRINLVAFKTNNTGNLFWSALGWELKSELNLYEYVIDSKNRIG